MVRLVFPMFACPGAELTRTFKDAQLAERVEKTVIERRPFRIDRIGAWELDPVKTGLVTEYAVVADVLFAYAPISMAPCSNNGPCGVKRFGHHHIGGVDCTAAGPFGSYRWSVSGAQLTLTAIHEPCGQRRAIWEGTWTRVH